MLACTDVYYGDDGAVAACVLFERWDAAEPARVVVEHLDQVEPYQPGALYLRELPCLLAVLRKAGVTPEAVIVDGYVWLGEGMPGLGSHLHDALSRIPTVGVAKSSFAGAQAIEVYRGRSRRPLLVTAAGMDAHAAASHVAAMHGPYRIPTMLRLADWACRQR